MPLDRDSIIAAARAAGYTIPGVTDLEEPAGPANLDLNFAIPAAAAGAGASNLQTMGPSFSLPPGPPADTTIPGAPPPTVIPQGVKLPGFLPMLPGNLGPPPKVPSGPDFADQVGAALSQKVGMPSANTPKDDSDSTSDVHFYDGGGGSSKQQGPTFATIPAHDVSLISPENRDKMNSAMRAELGAVNAQSAADQGKVDMQRRMAADEQAFYADQAEQQKQRAAAQKAIMDRHLADQQVMADEIANTKIDPSAYWSKKSDGQKVAAMMYAALGGWLAGRSGTRNEALDRIDHEVDREVQTQVANLQNKRENLQNARSLYAQKLQQFGVEDAAAAATKADLYNSLLAKAKGYLADSDQLVADANAKKAVAGLAQRVVDANLKTTQYVQAQTVQTGGGDMYGGQAGTVDGTPINIGGGKYIIPHDNIGGDLAKKIALNTTIIDKLGRLQAMLDARGVGDKAFNTQQTNEIKRAIADLKTDYTVAKGQGAMSEGDSAVTGEAIGSLSGLSDYTGDAGSLVRQARAAMQRSNRTQIQTMGGGTIYQRAGFKVNKSGQLQPTWVPVGEYGGDTGGAKPVTTFTKDN